MSFTTNIFMFVFLPAAVILYALAGLTGSTKVKNIVLLGLSLCFYGWCGLAYLVLLGVMVVLNYIGATGIAHTTYKKRWLFSVLLLDIAVLAFCKYFNFFMENIESMVHTFGNPEFLLAAPKIPLPLGISFFVFQIISYLTDVYRGQIKEQNLLQFALFIMLFPQLIEGPILRYQELAENLNNRNTSYGQLEHGTRRFIAGFAKKLLIADKLVPLTDAVFAMADSGIPLGYAWLGAISYAFVIYFDFSGYSDMAIGLCEIFGFKVRENFNDPYVAVSLQDFWRRWHISLSTWFRDYVYIPLGGNRNGGLKTYRNIMIVFLLTGIWHGASWSFLIWGLYHGAFRLLEQIGFNKLLIKLPRIAGHIYAKIVIITGWVFFRADSLHQACSYVKSMFIPVRSDYAQFDILRLLNGHTIFVLVMGIVFSTPVIRFIADKYCKKHIVWIENTVYTMLFIISLAAMMGSSYSPSIYSKF